MSGTRQSGIALVIVLWGVTLLALLAAGFAQSTGLAARRMAHVVDSALARAQLDEALAAAVVGLTQPDPARRWRGDGSLHQQSISAAAAEISVIAESGRIDLNRSPPTLLQALWRQVAGDDAVADQLTKGLAARTDPPRGRPVLAVAELGSLAGMTAPVYRRLAHAATVHNPSGVLDWRIAGKSSLAAILSPSQIVTLLAMRRQRDYLPDPATALALTQAGASLEASPVQTAIRAEMVTVRLKVTLAGGAAASAEILLQLLPEGTQPFRILEWRAPAWSTES